jgi:hypothetical protein
MMMYENFCFKKNKENYLFSLRRKRRKVVGRRKKLLLR